MLSPCLSTPHILTWRRPWSDGSSSELSRGWVDPWVGLTRGSDWVEIFFSFSWVGLDCLQCFDAGSSFSAYSQHIIHYYYHAAFNAPCVHLLKTGFNFMFAFVRIKLMMVMIFRCP